MVKLRSIFAIIKPLNITIMRKLYSYMMSFVAIAAIAFSSNAQSANEITFDLSVSEISMRNARVKIVPGNPRQKYVFDVVTKALVERAGGLGNLFEYHDKSYWEFVASMYDGMTWQEVAEVDLCQGTIEDLCTDIPALGQLHWDEDYYLYAYALDDDFNPSSDVFAYEFKTLAPEMTDLTFNVTLNEIVADADNAGMNKAVFTIVPSNDEDTYGNHMHEVSFYDFYVDNPDFTYEDYLENQVYPYIFSTRKGTQTLTYRNIKPSKEYIFITTGWNEAPTTDDITIYRFSGEETAGLSDNLMQNATAIGYGGKIIIDGEYDGAAVYGIDGKLRGTYRNVRSIDTAPGMYIVKLQTNKQVKTIKVVVK